MIWVAIVTLAFVGLMLQVAALTGQMFEKSRCLCRKGAINFQCPIHGFDRR